jgi:two-component system, OmpR family, heavy metal sensor histidine kinase CusS
MFKRKISINLSIKGRLTVLLIMAAVAFSYVIFVSVHENLHSSLSRIENDFVYLRLHALRAIIHEQPNYIDIIRQDIEWEGKYTKFPEYFLRITDPTGRVLIETTRMENVIPSAQRGPFPNIADPKNEDVIRRGKNGRYFLLMADSVTVPNDSEKKLTLEIALDVTLPITIDEANHKRIIFIIIIELFIFAAIIILIVQKGVQPLEDLVKIADKITVNNLAESIIATDRLPKEVRRLAISFNGMFMRLTEAFTRLHQCTSDMAHEIRTPINNIMGEAEIALSKERTPEEYRRVLVSGIEECEHLSQLISSLLFLARAENPADSINRVLFDPLDVIKDILSFYEPQIEGKRAEISWYGNGRLNGDPLLFRRAVSNLLKNSLNYSNDGVKINISIRETGDQHLEVVVSDTGYGMKEEDLVRIFDRFYRVDRANSNNSEGSGLGLSIIKAIMDLHGGSISIVSRPGEGTTVTLRFLSSDILPGHRS